MPPYDVQGYVIVFVVSVVTVALPLTGFYVHLDVSGYHLIADGEDSVLEVAAGSVTASAWMNYAKLFTVVSNQFGHQLVLPDAGN